MARRFRPRKEFKFWLYHDLAEDARIMEFIQYCKSTRQFARVLRDGIRLIWSLREGNLAILFELFPHLERQFNPDADVLIEQFRDMLLSNRQIIAQPAAIESTVGEGGRQKKLSAVKLDLPVIIDDDDDAGETIVLNRVTDSSNSETAMAALRSIAF